MNTILNKILSLLLLIIFSPLIFLIAILVYLTSRGPIIYWSKRFGQNNTFFFMPKFRTMIDNAPQKATHLMKNHKNLITKVGYFLRKTSLDELPQLYSILIGKMNFIGPRPALFNQNDLIALRTKNNIHFQKPGVTGWAQINGRDSLSLHDKVVLEKYYLENASIFLDLRILFLTVIKVLKKDSISH